jgi:hypothetical protein
MPFSEYKKYCHHYHIKYGWDLPLPLCESSSIEQLSVIPPRPRLSSLPDGALLPQRFQCEALKIVIVAWLRLRLERRGVGDEVEQEEGVLQGEDRYFLVDASGHAAALLALVTIIPSGNDQFFYILPHPIPVRFQHHHIIHCWSPWPHPPPP